MNEWIEHGINNDYLSADGLLWGSVRNSILTEFHFFRTWRLVQESTYPQAISEARRNKLRCKEITPCRFWKSVVCAVLQVALNSFSKNIRQSEITIRLVGWFRSGKRTGACLWICGFLFVWGMVLLSYCSILTPGTAQASPWEGGVPETYILLLVFSRA